MTRLKVGGNQSACAQHALELSGPWVAGNSPKFIRHALAARDAGVASVQ
jgi:hypothetical protein